MANITTFEITKKFVLFLSTTLTDNNSDMILKLVVHDH